MSVVEEAKKWLQWDPTAQTRHAVSVVGFAVES